MLAKKKYIVGAARALNDSANLSGQFSALTLGAGNMRSSNINQLLDKLAAANNELTIEQPEALDDTRQLEL